jgi:hypothetical protein
MKEMPDRFSENRTLLVLSFAKVSYLLELFAFFRRTQGQQPI